jgi:pilus assembly protein CpaD
MTALPIAGRRSRAALRLLAGASLAAMLGGCYHTQVTQESFPADYRLRHPITVSEGERTVEVFVGPNRGGLTPTQRADVLAFAQRWQREATSGIVVDVPRGGPTDRAAADSMREIHSIFAASGIPRKAVFVRHYRPARSALASIKINYSKLVAHAGPAVSGRKISGLPAAPNMWRTGNTGISAAPRSTTSLPWWPTRRTSYSRAAKRRPTPRNAR